MIYIICNFRRISLNAFFGNQMSLELLVILRDSKALLSHDWMNILLDDELFEYAFGP